jgi:hypothetical protein
MLRLSVTETLAKVTAWPQELQLKFACQHILSSKFIGWQIRDHEQCRFRDYLLTFRLHDAAGGPQHSTISLADDP